MIFVLDVLPFGFGRTIDHLAKIKHDGDVDTAGDTGEADHDRAGACEEDLRTHSTHPPDSHSATADPDQLLVLPKTEWSDESLETSSVPSLQPVDLAPVAGLSGVGPIETGQSVLSIAALSEVAVHPGGPSSSGSTSPATFGNIQANHSQSPPTPSVAVAADSVTSECCVAGALPSSSGLSSQPQFRVMEMPAQVMDATTRQAFGEKVAYWGERRDGAVTLGGGDAGGDGKISGEQSAFGLKFFWPCER